MFGSLEDGIELEVAKDKVAESEQRQDSYRLVIKALVGKVCALSGKPTVTISPAQLEAADERYQLRYCTADEGSVTLWLERSGAPAGNILAPDSKIVLAR